jgi:hypothetical protein
MKNRRFVRYFMIMLMLFQSFSTVANTVDFNATDPQHFEQQHQHSNEHSVGSVNKESLNKPLKNLDDDKYTTASHDNPVDCHHCGHCHGTHVQWLGQQAPQNTDLAQQSHQFSYLRAVTNAAINPLLRPPRA